MVWELQAMTNSKTKNKPSIAKHGADERSESRQRLAYTEPVSARSRSHRARAAALAHAMPVLAFLLAAITIFLLNKTSSQLLEFKPSVVPPKEMLHFTLGHQMTIADSLWLRALQADDFCESDAPKSPFATGILLDDVLKSERPPSRCHKGWVYQMFDVITDLNPDFRTVYKLGGVQLSIVVDDREGARLIFEKGIERISDDWQLLYRAAYHYIFEIQNVERAQQLLEAVTKFPDVPPVIHLLAARLASVTGRGELALSILDDYLKDADPTSTGYKSAKERRTQLQEALKSHSKKN